MLKKSVVFIAALAAAVSLTACGNKAEEKSNIVDKVSNSAPTFMPAATAAPDSGEKAAQKVAESGETNVSVKESDGTTREVDMSFQMINKTGIDFVQMFIEPITKDIQSIAKGTPRFEKGFVFKNDAIISLDPPAQNEDGSSYTLGTTLFNIAAVDANGTGYVFQNIDLASSSTIALLMENGVPKAVIDPVIGE